VCEYLFFIYFFLYQIHLSENPLWPILYGCNYYLSCCRSENDHQCISGTECRRNHNTVESKMKVKARERKQRINKHTNRNKRTTTTTTWSITLYLHLHAHSFCVLLSFYSVSVTVFISPSQRNENEKMFFLPSRFSSPFASHCTRIQSSPDEDS